MSPEARISSRTPRRTCAWLTGTACLTPGIRARLGSAGGSAAELAAGVLPFARVLAAAGVAGAAALLPPHWAYLWDGRLTEQGPGGPAARAPGLGASGDEDSGAAAEGDAGEDQDAIEEA
jgi:hypothetical protein